MAVQKIEVIYCKNVGTQNQKCEIKNNLSNCNHLHQISSKSTLIPDSTIWLYYFYAFNLKAITPFFG